MTQLSQEEQEQLLQFNEQYTKYLGQYVYGTEVLTLKNKYDNDKKVEVIIIGDLPVYGENSYKYDEGSDSYSNDTTYYKCTNITYNNKNGRVDSITFEQIKMSAEAGS